MVQVLDAPEGFGAQFGRAIGQGAGQGFSSAMESRKRMQELVQENEAIKKETGIDLSGITNPEARKEAFSNALKTASQEKILHMQGIQKEKLLELQGAQKEKLFEKKQESISSIFGGGQKKDGDKISSEQTPADLSDEDIFKLMAIDPNLGRAAISQREFQEKRREKSPEFQRDQQVTKSQAQADVKYNQQLQEAAKQHELKEQALDRLEKLNRKGVTGKPYEKLLEKAGLVALTSDGRREFAADVKNLITDIRSILGAQFTGFEFQTILNAYPSADFSKEANAAIIRNLKDFQDIKKKEVEFANLIKRENKGKIPADFQSQVNDMVREYASSKLPQIKANTRKIRDEEHGIKPGFVLMFDPQGEPLNVPENEIERFESLGATLP